MYPKYEIYSLDQGQTWYLVAEGISLQDTNKQALIQLAIDFVQAFADLGFNSQLIIKNAKGEIESRSEW